MKRCFMLLVLLVAGAQSYAQPTDEATSYKNLKTLKSVSGGGIFTATTSPNGKGMIYTSNGKEIDKATYDKFESGYKNMENCCPCILESYDENDVLRSKKISCQDCSVGWFKIYFPNGKAKLFGHNKENPTNDWEDIWKRGYCSVKHGQWVYFNEFGDTLKSEFWENNELIKQIPEPDKAEVWRIDLIANGRKYDTSGVSIENFKFLKVVPRYKGKLNDDENYSLKLIVGGFGHSTIKEDFTLNNFEKVDIRQIIKEEKFTSTEKWDIDLQVFYKGEQIEDFTINVQH